MSNSKWLIEKAAKAEKALKLETAKHEATKAVTVALQKDITAKVKMYIAVVEELELAVDEIAALKQELK